MGLETVRKNPQEGMGIPRGRGEISVVKQKSVQNQALKLQATNDPWKHLVTHVNLLPAEGDIGKDLGDVRMWGGKGKDVLTWTLFVGSCSALHRIPWQYLICHVFMLFASIALLACEGGVCVVFRA